MGGELNEAISLPQLPPFESSSVWSGSHHPSEGEIGVGGGGDGAGPCPLPPSLKRATLPNSPEAVVPSYQSHLKTILLLPSVPVLEG